MSKIVTVFIIVYIVSVAIFLGKVKDVITVSIANDGVKALYNKSYFNGKTTEGRNTKMLPIGENYAHILIFLQVCTQILCSYVSLT